MAKMSPSDLAQKQKAPLRFEENAKCKGEKRFKKRKAKNHRHGMKKVEPDKKKKNNWSRREKEKKNGDHHETGGKSPGK